MKRSLVLNFDFGILIPVLRCTQRYTFPLYLSQIVKYRVIYYPATKNLDVGNLSVSITNKLPLMNFMPIVPSIVCRKKMPSGSHFLLYLSTCIRILHHTQPFHQIADDGALLTNNIALYGKM